MLFSKCCHVLLYKEINKKLYKYTSFSLLSQLFSRIRSGCIMDQSIELSWYTFPTPCTIALVGPSGSRKTTLLINGILKYRKELFRPADVAGVLFFYSKVQPAFERLRAEENIKLFKGLPSKEEFEMMLESFEGRHCLVILDDLMAKMAQSPLGQDIFTKLSHHRSVLRNISSSKFEQWSSQTSSKLAVVVKC